MKLAFAFCLSLPLWGGATFFNSSSDFFSTAGATTTETFNAVPDGSYNTASGLTSNGVNLVGRCTQTSTGQKWCGGDFQMSASGGTIIGPLALYAYSPYGSQDGDLVVTLPYAVHAAGFDFTVDASTPNGRLLLLLSTGDTSPTVTAATGQPGYFGFLSDTPVTSFTVRVLNPGFEYSRIYFDNLSFDTTVPEPAQSLSVGALLYAMAVLRRLR